MRLRTVESGTGNYESEYDYLFNTVVNNVEKSRKMRDESAIDEVKYQMMNTLADPDYYHIEAVITYNDTANKGIIINNPSSVDIGSGTTEKELRDYLNEVAYNIEDVAFMSNVYKENSKVTFVIKDERVTVYRAALDERIP